VERLRVLAKYGYDGSAQEFRYEAFFQKRDGQGEQLTPRYARQIPFFLVEALHDLGREMTARGGFWSKLMDIVGVSEEARLRIEKLLEEVNAELGKDKTMSAVRDRLTAILESVMNLEKKPDGVVISPLPQEAGLLVRRSEVYVKGPGADIHFPLTQFGMGAQSVGVLTLSRASHNFADLDGVDRRNLDMDAV